MFGLLALAALAIDLSSVYSTQQTEKAATDAAALAGAQNLGLVGTQKADVKESARAVAWATLEGRFGLSGLPCDISIDNSDCELGGTGYHAFISTPAKTTPTNQQSLQVTLTYPNFQLSFARLFGQNGWNVWRASVADNKKMPSYAVITLQPPAPKPKSGLDANLCNDIVVDGNGTQLNVLEGDIGTNTSATTTNKGVISLADGYQIYHIDDISAGGCSYGTPDATWSQDVLGNPTGVLIGPTPLLQDPAYPVADFTKVTPYATQVAGVVPCNGTDYPSDAATLALLTPKAGGKTTCYAPGIYNSKFSLTGNKDIAYLMPGAYEFMNGMQMNATLMGGLIDTQQGVVLVFPQTKPVNFLSPNNALAFKLNTGSASCSTDSCRATPAKDSTGNLIETPSHLTLTIEVPRDNSCFNGTNPINVTCNDTTVSLAGSGSIEVAGVIYAPSDNVTVAGNSSHEGLVGQIIAWTVKYSGQGVLNQSYPGGLGNGILRLDKACSGGDTSCSP